MTRVLKTLVATALCALVLAGCAVEPRGSTKDERREHVLRARDAFMKKATQKWPGLQAEIDAAAGYGFYDWGAMKVLFGGAASGFGVVVDNEKGWETVVKTIELSAGVGVEWSSTQAIVVLHTPEALSAALDGKSGWDVGAGAGIGLEFAGLGGDVTGAVTSDDTTTYRDMHSGFDLHVMLLLLHSVPNGLLN